MYSTGVKLTLQAEYKLTYSTKVSLKKKSQTWDISPTCDDPPFWTWDTLIDKKTPI